MKLQNWADADIIPPIFSRPGVCNGADNGAAAMTGSGFSAHYAVFSVKKPDV